MPGPQKRKSFSLAPADYELAKAQADQECCSIARVLTRAIHSYADPDLVKVAAKDAGLRGYPELDPESRLYLKHRG